MMVDENDLDVKREKLGANSNLFSAIQTFLDKNIRIVKNVSWIIGGVGIVIIIRRTYALHHFTSQSAIPKNYFKNNVTLAGRVLQVHSNGTLSVQHIPLLWSSRLKWISKPSSTLLDVNITGIELRDGGVNYLTSLLRNTNIKFKLLGKDKCRNIESIIYQNKSYFRQICVNEDVITRGYAVAHHVPSLSRVKAYNELIERLVKAELKAVKKRSGIWKDDTQNGVIYRAWCWFKSKLFKT